MYTHFRGTTFQFTGQFQDDGVAQDLTNCTVAANVYDQSGTVLYGALNVTFVDTPNGIIAVSFPNTSAWPVGKARIDCLMTLANGEIIASSPDVFRIAQTPIIG